MAKREEVTAGQIAEMVDWLRRLTPDEYQARRGLLRRTTDPGYDLNLRPRFWPFKFWPPVPVEVDLRVGREGAWCEGPIDISRLETVPFHKDGETEVSGEEMMRRARDAKNFPGSSDWSQHHAEQLQERAYELPRGWAQNGGQDILFPDTILLDEYRNRLVSCLVCGGGAWWLQWRWLGRVFGRHYRFLRLRPSTSQCGASKPQ